MGQLGLAESIAALRAELMEALEAGKDAEFGFGVGQIQLEFHVGVTRQAGASGKAKVWVLELGGDGSYRKEEIQRVTVTLEPPLDDAGRPIKVTRGLAAKP
ncbi:trypco2 family protein [Actinomadura sp. GTD37]|uniref:trypco2 family protein n=1 Tax=Actinomadura sp. GTD37 TaxID=1778030 RepID=UPI0035BF2689